MPVYINPQTLKIVGARIKAFGNEMNTLDPVSDNYVDDINAMCDSIDELVKDARKEVGKG